MSIYGVGERNREGEIVRLVCQARGLQLVNTKFKKDKEKLITYKSGGAITHIDFMLDRREVELSERDCKVIPGEACLSQHRLLCMYVR
jgi:hypothetical protein